VENSNALLWPALLCANPNCCYWTNRDHVRSELAQVLRSLRIPTIVVTHDWVDALALGDEMVVMSHGRVLQTGKPQDVLTRPQHREVASAVGVETVVTGRVKSRTAGVVLLQVGSAELVAADLEGDEFYVCIRGEDVTLEKGRAERSSARNHLKGGRSGDGSRWNSYATGCRRGFRPGRACHSSGC